MDQVHVIHHKVHIEAQSARCMAREMKLSRNPASKHLMKANEYHENPGA
jgi:hypothetical protein